MKEIRITYSWGDEELPVVIPNGEDPVEFMFKLVTKEAFIDCVEHCNEGIVTIIPCEDSAELHYHDGEVCYYSIVESSESNNKM